MQQIYQAQETLRIAREEGPNAKLILGDITFGGAIPAGIDPEEIKHQAENPLNVPLR